MNAKDRERLGHMYESCLLVHDITEDSDFDSFRDDSKLHLAVIRSVEIISLAAHKVSKEAQAEVSDLPWDEVLAMRSYLLARAEKTVDLRLIWSSVQHELDELAKILEPYVEPGHTSN